MKKKLNYVEINFIGKIYVEVQINKMYVLENLCRSTQHLNTYLLHFIDCST